MIKVALVGTTQEPRTYVARRMESAHQFKYMPMSHAVEKIYRSLYYNEKFSRVPWEKRTKIYDALYEVDNDIFINYLFKRLETTTRNVVVPDARYVSEIDALREQGFFIVRINYNTGSPPRPSKALLNAGSGTVILAERYAKSKIKVDYSVSGETWQGLKATTDFMVEQLKQSTR